MTLREDGWEKQVLQNGYDKESIKFLRQLQDDFDDLAFRSGRKYMFRPPKTVIIGPFEQNWKLLLLHEVGHALLRHRDFNCDIQRLRMEAEAWDKARELAAHYHIRIDEDLIEEELDTYRDWLHQKSRCPVCGLTRFQTPDKRYHCPLCERL